MDLSFSEVAVLAAAADGPQTRSGLARRANLLYKSSKYSESVALVDIKNLEQRRFLALTTDGRGLELTRDGWAAMMNAMGEVEALRNAIQNASYRVRM